MSLLGKPDTKHQPFRAILLQHTHSNREKDANDVEYRSVAVVRQVLIQQQCSHKTPRAYESKLGQAGCQLVHKEPDRTR